MYKGVELEPLRMSHVEVEKIPTDERHEHASGSIIFDANNRIRGIVMPSNALQMDSKFKFVKHNEEIKRWQVNMKCQMRQVIENCASSVGVTEVRLFEKGTIV